MKISLLIVARFRRTWTIVDYELVANNSIKLNMTKEDRWDIAESIEEIAMHRQ